MKYQHQRVDLRSFLLREVPKSQLDASLRRRVEEALRGEESLRAVTAEVLRSLIASGTLREGGRLREGPDRIPLYVLPGSPRAYDLRSLLGEDAEPAAPAVSTPVDRPVATDLPSVAPPNGGARASLEAIRRTLQRDWVSYGPEASLEVIMEELAERLASARVHLRLLQSELPQRLESGPRWTVFEEGDPQAAEWLRRIRHGGTSVVDAGGGEVWAPVLLAEEVVGALQAPRSVPRDLLLCATETLTALLGAFHRSRRRVYMDPLTGLNNRGFFEQQISVELERSARSNQELALLFVDIDHFKAVNDEYGHDAGDLVLQIVAQHLVAGLRRIDSVSRWGGEEFAMLLPATGREQGVFIANRLRSAVESQRIQLSDGQDLRVTISMGVSVAPHHAAGGEKELLRHADQALYEAKRRGRNRVCLAPTPAD